MTAKLQNVGVESLRYIRTELWGLRDYLMWTEDAQGISGDSLEKRIIDRALDAMPVPPTAELPQPTLAERTIAIVDRGMAGESEGERERRTR